MTIAIGSTAAGASSFVAAVATSSVTTSSTGSTFYVSVIQTGGTALPIVVTDSKTNTYTQIGTAIGDGSSRWITRFQCVNGAGGTAHTATATQTGGTNSISAFLIEITGASLSSPLDQSATNAAGFVAPPVSSGNVTVAPPASGEVLISTYSTEDSGAAIPFSEANGFTIKQSTQTSGAGASGSIATKVVTSSGTYNASWTDGTGGNNMAAVIDSFKGATAGAFLLTASAGAFTLTGEAANLIAVTPTDFSLLPNAGIYNLAGAASTTDSQLDAVRGVYALAGQAATFTGSGLPTVTGADPLPIPRHKDWQSQQPKEIEKARRIARRLDRSRRGLPADEPPPKAKATPAPRVDTSDVPDDLRDMAATLARTQQPKPTPRTAPRELTEQEKSLMKFVPMVRALK